MPEHKYIAWNSVELEDLNPLLKRQFVVGDSVMLARVLLKKGCLVPLHSHHNEQVTYILEGAPEVRAERRGSCCPGRRSALHTSACAP